MMKGNDAAELSGHIADIYECALDREHWVPALQRIGNRIAACAGMIFRHGAKTVSFEYGWGTPEEWQDLYRTKYISLNPLLTAGWHFDVDDPFCLRRFMDPTEFMRSAFYMEF